MVLGAALVESARKIDVGRASQTDGSYQTTLLCTRPKTLYLYCDEINPLYNELNGQFLKLLITISIDGHYIANHAAPETTYSPLVINRFYSYLHFKLLDENQHEAKHKKF